MQGRGANSNRGPYQNLKSLKSKPRKGIPENWDFTKIAIWRFVRGVLWGSQANVKIMFLKTKSIHEPSLDGSSWNNLYKILISENLMIFFWNGKNFLKVFLKNAISVFQKKSGHSIISKKIKHHISKIYRFPKLTLKFLKTIFQKKNVS